jgi:hypothetical protein
MFFDRAAQENWAITSYDFAFLFANTKSPCFRVVNRAGTAVSGV